MMRNIHYYLVKNRTPLDKVFNLVPISLLPDRIGYHFVLFKEIKKLHVVEYCSNELENYALLKNGRVFYGPIFYERKDKLTEKEKYFYTVRNIITHYLYAVGIPALHPPYAKSCHRSVFGRFSIERIDDLIKPYEENRLLFYDRLSLKHDSVFVDCGCWIGYGCLRASDYIRSGKIIAIEADNANYKIARKNFEVNNVKSVQLIQAATYKSSGKIEFFREEDRLQKTGGGIPKYLLDSKSDGVTTEATKKINVVSVAVDDILRDDFKNYKHLLINITTNGAELDTIKGLKMSLSLDIPIGIHTICRDEETYSEMKSILEEMGFCVVRGSSFRVLAVK